MRLLKYKGYRIFLVVAMPFCIYFGVKDFLEKKHNYFIQSVYRIKADSVFYKKDSPIEMRIKDGYQIHSISDEAKEIFPYLRAGDSIVKESGSSRIIIYRHDSTGRLKAKIFD